MSKKIYIVYDPYTLIIHKRFEWFGQAHDYADKNELLWCNSTHPINKNLLPMLKERGSLNG